MSNDRYSEIDKLINGAFQPGSGTAESSTKLRMLFNVKLAELEMTFNQATDSLQVEFRSLNGYLDGEYKKLDIVILQKIAAFLDIQLSTAMEYYAAGTAYSAELAESKVRAFIAKHFDLNSLKRTGFIDDTKNYKQIEDKIKNLFGFTEIFEYQSNIVHPAFSASKRKSASLLPRDFWVRTSIEYFRRTPNIYEYDRQGLIDYFPNIRWHTMNVEKGLLQVTRSLYRYGVTVIFVPYVSGANVRGATFSLNGKPCVAITNYTDYYPTLWFALIHELYHVIFDWDEIKEQQYHISSDNDLFTMKEEEANAFARDYLFSKDKMSQVLPHLKDRYFVQRFAEENHIHPSIIYAFHAYQNSGDKRVWAQLKSLMPDHSACLAALGNNPWQKARPIKEICKILKEEIFNV